MPYYTSAGRNSIQNPSDNPYPVTPNDNVDLASGPCCFCVAVGGDIKVTTAAGNTVVLTVPAGVYPARVKRIWSASTTATGITALP